MSERINTVIIGGGCIGCAIAYTLSPSRQVLVIEQEPHIPADNQSTRNSGVVHAGIYYERQRAPLKASLCVKGNKMLYQFCLEHEDSVPCKMTGKLVVAASSEELPFLEHTRKIGLENRVPGLRMLDRTELTSFEPNVSGIAALLVPSSGVVDPAAYVKKLKLLAEARGAMILTGTKVVSISHNGVMTLTAESNGTRYRLEAENVVNAAGLHSGDIARMINPRCDYSITPTRGEIAKFNHSKRSDISIRGMNIYPVFTGYETATGKNVRVPLDDFLSLEERGKITRTVGVHITPTFDGASEGNMLGPTAIIGPLKSVNVGMSDYANNLKHPLAYYERIKTFFPHIRPDDISLHYTGIMAVPTGQFDFIIERDPVVPRCLQLIGIESPGLTASLAIGEYVREMIDA
ncbi:MAG TPA: FAD-dependent oxidoreductase [Bacteroidota bacterium]|nr:FAD-dependent oxidoreductase [Bacteroidota bacterium]